MALESTTGEVVIAEQLKHFLLALSISLGELLAIEADTYAEFVRTGKLNKELSLFLQTIYDKAN